VTTRQTASERLVLGRYLLGPKIGHGATATVYRARDKHSGRWVAVKEVADPGLAPRAGAEIRASTRLAHPGIVAVLDWGEEDGALLIVSELVHGDSLASRLHAGDRPTDSESLSIAQTVFSALAHAHENGVVHRDVKPGNILLDADGSPRLGDFGIARLSGDVTVTAAGAVVGTMAYMAPEQARGERAGAPADVYAMGIVTYELLAGQNPLIGSSPAITARRAAAAAVPPLSEVRPDLPADTCRAIDALLARDPDARPDAAHAGATLGAPGLLRRFRAERAIRVGASVAGAATLAGLAAWLGASLDPLASLGVAAAGGALAGWRPRLAAVVLGIFGVVLLAQVAVGAAIVLGVAGLIALIPLWSKPRLMLAPAAAPALAIVSLVPLFPAGAAVFKSWLVRLWLGAAGAVAIVMWEIATGTGAGMLGSTDAQAVHSAIADERSPLAALGSIGDAITADPELLTRAGVLVAAAIAARPALAGPEASRIMRAGAWCIGILVGFALTAAAPIDGAAAALPACVIVLVIAARPWTHLRQRPTPQASATLRGPT
jgi:hypothetical protein